MSQAGPSGGSSRAVRPSPSLEPDAPRPLRRSTFPGGLWLGALVLTCLWGCVTASALRLPAEAVSYRAQTKDGWGLSLVEYRAVGTPKGRPVLLVHGISANARTLDLDAQHSLARWFAAHGRDAWTVSLRGTGDSDGVDAEQGRPPGYTFDTLACFDLPAAIDFVRQAEHVPAIDYVGHSMGGMLLYAYLAEGGQGIAAAATLGSPTRLDFGGARDPVMIDLLDHLVPTRGPFSTQFAARWLAPSQAGWAGSPVATIFYNPRNMDPHVWRELLAVGVEDISGPLLIQLGALIRTGDFQSADGKIDYRRDMARIRTPLLVVAGKADHIATAMAVKDGYRALGGEKEWLLLGEENGVQAGYGHLDLVIGERAATELWPKLIDFFDRHGG